MILDIASDTEGCRFRTLLRKQILKFRFVAFFTHSHRILLPVQ